MGLNWGEDGLRINAWFLFGNHAVTKPHGYFRQGCTSGNLAQGNDAKCVEK